MTPMLATVETLPELSSCLELECWNVLCGALGDQMLARWQEIQTGSLQIPPSPSMYSALWHVPVQRVLLRSNIAKLEDERRLHSICRQAAPPSLHETPISIKCSALSPGACARACCRAPGPPYPSRRAHAALLRRCASPVGVHGLGLPSREAIEKKIRASA